MTDSFLFLFTEYFLAQRLWHACTHDINVHSPGVFTKRVTSFTTCSKVSVRAFLIANSGVKTFFRYLVEIAYTKTSACAPSKHWNTHTHCFVYFWKNKNGPGHRGNFHEPNYQTTKRNTSKNSFLPDILTNFSYVSNGHPALKTAVLPVSTTTENCHTNSFRRKQEISVWKGGQAVHTCTTLGQLPLHQKKKKKIHYSVNF